MKKTGLDGLRWISPELVMLGLGCVRDRRERNKWRSPQNEVITLDGDRVYNHSTGAGGGGAGATPARDHLTARRDAGTVTP